MYAELPQEEKEAGEAFYTGFLRDTSKFQRGMKRVAEEWPISAEHNLTNCGMNRIAYLGQSAVCIETGIPRCCRGGFYRLSEYEQFKANLAALYFLNQWLLKRGESEVTIKEAVIGTVRDRFIEYGNEPDRRMFRRIVSYIKTWKSRGYESGIPDEVPDVLRKLNKAPSYKAVALAILKQDYPLKSLGMVPKVSRFYSELKRLEIEEREKISQEECV